MFPGKCRFEPRVVSENISPATASSFHGITPAAGETHVARVAVTDNDANSLTPNYGQGQVFVGKQTNLE